MSPVGRILVVDDKPSFRFIMEGYLEGAGHRVHCVAGAAEALQALETGPFDLVLSDLVMPDMDGVALLGEVQRRHPGLPFVLITGHGSVDTAVAAMKQGAADYLVKPLHREELLLVLDRLLAQAQLRVDYQRMRDHEREQFSFQNIHSLSPAMGKALAAAKLVAGSASTTVTILGESGVGKEVLARAIHLASGHDLTRFVAVNCAAIPETLLESELFGHVKGAFTGADQDREGKCGRAQGGTLFLDEIGDMPLPLQAKLLRLLENRVYERVGSDRPLEARFRVIVATHRDLEACAHQGSFRPDLYHRLNVFPITIPPLRDRREDIPLLAEVFLKGFREHQGRPLPGLSQAALDLLVDQPWPGNIRELRNLLEYATIVTHGDLIRPEHLRPQAQAAQPGAATSPDRITLTLDLPRDNFSLEAVTQQVTQWALDQCGQNKSSAARMLKATRKIFY